MLRFSAIAAGSALTIFHVSLFWDRLVGGDLLDPAVALRWAGAVLIVSALVILRRFGVPLLHGRRAFSVWLLVALLHASKRVGPGHRNRHGHRTSNRLHFRSPLDRRAVRVQPPPCVDNQRRLAPSPFVICRVPPGTTDSPVFRMAARRRLARSTPRVGLTFTAAIRRGISSKN